MKSPTFLRAAAALFVLTALGIAISGYHLGIEDQAIYLPAIEKQLNQGLFPRDAELFLAQTKPTIFPQTMAAAVRLTHLPLAWIMFLGQVISILLLLWACLRVARIIFDSRAAQWAGVALVAAMLTLPVSGTALAVSDQYLHPRLPATALLLFMLAAVMERKLLRAFFFFVAATLLHVQMAFYGALLAIFFLLPERWFAERVEERRPQKTTASLAAFPLTSLFQPPSAAWREAARTRWQLYLARWPWYCWLGIFAPLALLAWFSRIGISKQMPQLRQISLRLLSYGILIFLAATLTIPARFERLVPYQPMRGYHLLYIFLLLLAGGLLGKFFLKQTLWRWLVVFLPLAAAMFYVQRQVFPSSPQIEWPSASERNPWLQSFVWVQQNTPENAYFALDPSYMARPGDDEHGFRALAQRSMMADYVKDSGVALLFPGVAPRWQKEVAARAGWPEFRKPDFERLQEEFGVDWVLLERSHPAAAELNCPYANEGVAVCRLN